MPLLHCRETAWEGRKDVESALFSPFSSPLLADPLRAALSPVLLHGTKVTLNA
jgi:hypothetical protein